MSNKKASKPRVVVLLSGGIDSASTLAVYRAKKNPVEALFIDYGQSARRSEWAAAQAIAKHYKTPISKIRLGLDLQSDNGEFFGRNALLMLLAASAVTDRPLVVASGINAASSYYDTTAPFVGDLQRILDGYAGGAISLGVPFLEMDKPTVVKFARRHRVPLKMTYSCECRNAPPCGSCRSCEDRKACRVE
jgi:7-cyano-7-deazaguanine synthase